MSEKYTSNDVFMQMPAKKEVPKPFGSGYKKPDLAVAPSVEVDTRGADTELPSPNSQTPKHIELSPPPTTSPLHPNYRRHRRGTSCVCLTQ